MHARPNPAESAAPRAYSYVRFSSDRQEDGNSKERQTERAAAYAFRNGLTLDTTLNLQDLGVSAFRGKNALNGNLRVFLDAIQTGRVVPGSVLIIESFDRLSRQGIDEGYDLVKGILKAGVRIVTLSPERSFDREATRGLTKGALEIQMILERAAEESETKSDRIQAAHEAKVKAARNGTVQPPRKKDGRITKAITNRTPGWIREKDGELELIPEHKETVRKLFKWAASGRGYMWIVKRLNDEKVPLFPPDRKTNPEKERKWSRTTIVRIINDGRAIGVFQPRKSDGRKLGYPIPNYYPPAVSEADYHAALSAIGKRRKVAGSINRKGKGGNVNVFVGLVRDPLDQGPYFMTLRYIGKGDRRRKTRVLINRSSINTDARMTTFPYEIFERAICSQLAELKPEDVVPPDVTPDAIRDAENEMGSVRGRIAELKSELLRGGPVATLAEVLRELERREAELETEIANAKGNAAVPPADSWRNAQTLIGLLDEAKKRARKRPHGLAEIRIRLRTAIRRVVKAIDVKFIGHGRDRVAIAKVHFHKAGTVRGYVIVHRPPLENRHARIKGGWWCRSFAEIKDFTVGGWIAGEPNPAPARTAAEADYDDRFLPGLGSRQWKSGPRTAAPREPVRRRPGRPPKPKPPSVAPKAGQALPKDFLKRFATGKGVTSEVIP